LPSENTPTSQGPSHEAEQGAATQPESAQADLEYVKGIVRRLGPIVPLAVIATVLTLIGLVILGTSMSASGDWLRAQGPWAITIYILGFAVLAGFALLPTHIQAVLGGWVFGLMIGTPAALAGILGASLIGYLVAGRISGDRAMVLIRERPKWQAVYDALIGGGFWKTLLIVTLVRVPPNSPFALTNLVMAATRVRWSAYAIGTVLGIAPRTAAAVFIGAQLSELTLANAKQSWFVISGLVALVAVVVVIGMLANRAVAKVTNGESYDAFK
jgi:uncharacterized membrane protein YdjX (TVP38/TMEM64 family)